MLTLKQKIYALLACLVVLSTGFAYNQVQALSFQELRGNVLSATTADSVQLTSAGNRNLKVTATPVSFDGANWTYRFDWQRTAKRAGSLYVNQKAIAASADPAGSATVVLPPSSRARIEFYGSPNGKGSLLLRKYLTTQPAVSQPTTNLTAETAKTAAQTSDVCTSQGTIGDFEGYNSSSQTWWFTLPRDPDHEGCSPACVVNDQTKEADINWRCTGGLPTDVTGTTTQPSMCRFFAAPSCPDGSKPVFTDPNSCNYTCPTKTCQPRPACLDNGPVRCYLQEPAEGWCPVTRPTSSAVSITKLDPTSGAIGTRVTITGTGFTEAAITASIPGNTTPLNTVLFNGMKVGQYYSFDGKTLSFTVPSSLAPNCAQGQICPTYAMVVTPGDYKVTVSNVNGTSNSVTFTVTTGEARACTMEAKLCPDNKTYVSRDPLNNCEFKPCPTVAMCDYAAPPQGCSYIPGPNYNSTTQCGMILSCPARSVSITTSDPLNVTKGTASTITFYASAASVGAFSPINQYKFTETGSVPGMTFTSCPPCNAGPGMMCSMVCSANSVALTGTPTTAGSYPITITATDSNGNTGTQNFTVTVSGGGSTCTYPIPMPLCPNGGTPVFNSSTCSYACPTVDCPLYWYFDNTSTSCQQKRFCGSFMYLGLETFSTQEQCNTALQNKNKPASCDSLQNGAGASYFSMCKSSGYTSVCFNKNTGDYQGCVSSSRDDCTTYNVNAGQNMLCPIPGVPTVPVINSFSPSSGAVGTPISILGTGFDATGNYVNFGGYGIQNMPSTNDGKSISVTVPPISTGTVQVSVSSSRGQSQPVSFTVTNASVVCSTEARLCPDNKTYVSRTGPNCEFAPCPPVVPICPNYTPPAPDWCATGSIVSQGIGPDGCQLPPKCVYPDVPPTCNYYVAPTCPNGGKPVFRSGTCDYSCPTTPTPTCQYTTGLYCPNNSYNYDSNGCVSGCKVVTSY